MTEKPFWKKEKVWIAFVGVLAILAVFLGGAALGLSEDARSAAAAAIAGIVSFLIGGHALSDAAHSISSKAGSTSHIIVNEPQAVTQSTAPPPVPED